MSKEKQPIIALFHASWCGHCKNFLPVWDRLEEAFEQHNIKYIKLEREETDPELMDELLNGKIRGFPTILKIFNNKIEEYNGKRDFADIIKWAGHR